MVAIGLVSGALAQEDDDAMPGRDLTVESPAAAEKPAPALRKTIPFQPPSTFAMRIVVDSGDLSDVSARANIGAQEACRALFAEREHRCRGKQHVDVKEYHVLKSQPLTLAAYVDERALGHLAGIDPGYIDPKPSFRFATCPDDERFEDGERISDTLIAKDAAVCPANSADGSAKARYEAVAGIVRAEDHDGAPGAQMADAPAPRDRDDDEFVPRSMARDGVP